MKFDIYGRFELLILRENNGWNAYRTGSGLRRKEDGLMIPASLHESELQTFLDDIYHELAAPGQSIKQLP